MAKRNISKPITVIRWWSKINWICFDIDWKLVSITAYFQVSWNHTNVWSISETDKTSPPRSNPAFLFGEEGLSFTPFHAWEVEGKMNKGRECVEGEEYNSANVSRSLTSSQTSFHPSYCLSLRFHLEGLSEVYRRAYGRGSFHWRLHYMVMGNLYQVTSED